MVNNDVTEEHPSRKPAPWIENAVFYLKLDEILRKTLDTRNMNNAIQYANLDFQCAF